MQLRTGLDPYGLTYYLGMQGRGTPRANPTGGVGLEGFVKLTEEVGGQVIELADSWLKEMDDAGLKALRARLEKSDIVPVISSGPAAWRCRCLHSLCARARRDSTCASP